MCVALTRVTALRCCAPPALQHASLHWNNLRVTMIAVSSKWELAVCCCCIKCLRTFGMDRPIKTVCLPSSIAKKRLSMARTSARNHLSLTATIVSGGLQMSDTVPSCCWFWLLLAALEGQHVHVQQVRLCSRKLFTFFHMHAQLGLKREHVVCNVACHTCAACRQHLHL